MLGEKQKNNDFKWMNVGIAFSGPFVVQVTLGDGGISLCNNVILYSLYVYIMCCFVGGLL